MENQYELGNLLFGNSRGPFGFPDRKLVESQEWTQLLKALQMNYYCIMEDFYGGERRSDGLCATKYGGYQCKDDKGNVLFELFPYWWNGCSCKADEKNAELECSITKKYLSETEINDYYGYLFNENELSDEQKIDFNRLKLRMEEATREIQRQYVEHEKDCLMLKHNFIYKPDTAEEFWIDWYKYPFRDAHMSRPYSAEQIKSIFLKCFNSVSKKTRKREDGDLKDVRQSCILCGAEIKEGISRVCDKCASEYQF